METLADVVAAGRDRPGTAIEIVGRTTPYTYREFATNTWKAGNLLGHYGGHPGCDIAVVVAPGGAESESGLHGIADSTAPLLAILGATLLGASAWLTPEEPVDTPVLVLPSRLAASTETAPGCSVLGYGIEPAEPGIAHFEAETWSETPIAPPESVSPGDAALRIGATEYTHTEVLDAASDVVSAASLSEDSVVGLATPLTDPGALIAGVIAPMTVGATIVLSTDNSTLVERDSLTHLATADSDNAAGLRHVDIQQVTE